VFPSYFHRKRPPKNFPIPREGWEIPVTGGNDTLYALNEFAESIAKKKQPISNVSTSTLVSKSVDIILDSLYSQEIKFWKDYPKIKIE